MRIAVTGASGLLGRELIDVLVQRHHTAIAAVHHNRPDWPGEVEVYPLDLTDDQSVRDFVGKANAECIIHSAAMVDVDRCETEPELARELNARATERLIAAVGNAHTQIVYISTDYVFDGTNGPYKGDDPPNPINVYGQTKLEGETAVRKAGDHHAIVRTASIVGKPDPSRPTFLDNMLHIMQTNPPLKAPTDQYANTTPVDHLASAVVTLAERKLTGIWHIAGAEILSRYELALRIAKEHGLPETVVERVKFETLGRAAKRPLRGGLIVEKALMELEFV